MTKRDALQCVHEPFGDAYYFGPERLAARYTDDEKSRLESGFSESTYKTIMDNINRENTEVRSHPLSMEASFASEHHMICVSTTCISCLSILKPLCTSQENSPCETSYEACLKDTSLLYRAFLITPVVSLQATHYLQVKRNRARPI